MRHATRRHAGLPLALVTGALLASTACGAPSRPNLQNVELSAASYTTVDQLASASEYLVSGKVTGVPRDVPNSALPALHYWVVPVTLSRVVAQRPDVATRLKSGDVIMMGVQVLRASSDANLANYSELADKLPGEDDKPQAGESFVGFLVASTLGDFGSGYEAVGRARIEGAAAAYKGVPGPLNHKSAAPISVTTAIVDNYVAPAPWKSGADVKGPTDVPAPTLGSPAASPAP